MIRLSDSTTLVDARSLARAAGLGLQLGLLVLAIRQFHIEGDAFYRMSLIAAIGFPVHALLPRNYRLQFFIALSLVTVLTQLGPVGGAWLILCGAVLIALCHAPVRFSLRVALLLLVASLLAFGRAGWVQAPWQAAVWPILGSIFMFRLILYMVELEPQSTRPPLRFTLAYFFLLPNPCIPLFPVIDFKTLCRTYYDREALAIYERGLDWMLRGLLHLLLYRIVYHHLVIDAGDVDSVSSLVRYLLGNFLLYLRISGLFHLAIGILHLFGFRLPETHHLYYLAPSVSDFWRRANIYWRDFMLKAVYYPSFFRLRRWGAKRAMVASTALVFAATWLLHAYQRFWLRGDFPLSWPDAVFWGVLGLIVVTLSLRGSTRGRQLPVSRENWTLQRALARGVAVSLTFAFICVLWSVWSSESLAHWLALWSVLGSAEVTDLLLVLSVLGVVALLDMTFGTARRRSAAPQRGGRQGAVNWQTAANLAILLGLAFLQTASVATGSRHLARFVDSIADTRLNPRDLALLERGYYESISHLESLGSPLWDLEAKKPADWGNLVQAGAATTSSDFPAVQIRPNTKIEFKGSPFSTNRWGLRDSDYDLAKPPGTLRLAILGASTVMGSGVGDGETFEAQLEERLNQELAATAGSRIEIINFAVGGDTPLEQLGRLKTQVIRFDPDAVIVTGILRDLGLATVLAAHTAAGWSMPLDFVKEFMAKADIDHQTPEPLIAARLEPYVEAMLLAAYRQIVQECRDRGFVPMWFFQPMPVDGHSRQDETSELGTANVELLSRLAGQAGFQILILPDVFRSYDPETLVVAQWDLHPNARAHQLLAEGLYEALAGDQDVTFGELLLNRARRRLANSEP